MRLTRLRPRTWTVPVLGAVLVLGCAMPAAATEPRVDRVVIPVPTLAPPSTPAPLAEPSLAPADANDLGAEDDGPSADAATPETATPETAPTETDAPPTSAAPAVPDQGTAGTDTQPPPDDTARPSPPASATAPAQAPAEPPADASPDSPTPSEATPLDAAPSPPVDSASGLAPPVDSADGPGAPVPLTPLVPPVTKPTPPVASPAPRPAPAPTPAPAPAAEAPGLLRLDARVCRRWIVEHVPDADVTYRPGVDVRGRPVAPADATNWSQFEALVPDTLTFHIAVDPLEASRLRTRWGRPLPWDPRTRMGVETTDAILGTVTYDLVRNRFLIDGRPLITGQQDALAWACRQAMSGGVRPGQVLYPPGYDGPPLPTLKPLP